MIGSTRKFAKAAKNQAACVVAALCLMGCASGSYSSVAETQAPQTSRAYFAGEHGVYGIEFDTQNGAIEPMGRLVELEKTRFIIRHPTKDILYVARMQGEHKTGAKGKATALAVDPETGTLSLINEASTGGRNAAHIAINQTGNVLATASFHGATVSAHTVNPDGSLTDFVDLDTITDPGSGIHKLQSEPRPHAVRFSPDGRFAYVPDLGTDTIYIFAVDAASGQLTPASQHKVKQPAGSGTRHFDFHPSGKFAYVFNELLANITVFDRDAVSGALTQTQVISTLPEGYDGRKWGAEVRLHPSGKFLFASNRGHDSIAVFAVDQSDGTLSLVEIEPTRGETPRHFTLDPSARWLVVGNQYSSTVTAFSFNQETGDLTHTGQLVDLPRPAAVVFAN